MSARFWVGGTGNWSDNTNHWATSSNGSPGAALPTTLDTVTFDANSGGGTATLDQNTAAPLGTFTTSFYTGTLDLNGYTITTNSFVSTGSGTRTIKFSGGQLTLPSTGSVMNMGAATNLTIDIAGGGTVKLTSASGTNRTVTGIASASLPNLWISAGTGNITFNTVVCNNLDFTGFSGAFTSTSAAQTVTIGGNLTCSSGMTMVDNTTGAAGFTFQFTSTGSGNTVTTNGCQVIGTFYFSGIGGSWTFQDNVTFLNYSNGLGTKTIEVGGGTVYLGSNTFNMGALWTNDYPVVRALYMQSAVLNLYGGDCFDLRDNTTFTFDSGTSVVHVYNGYIRLGDAARVINQVNFESGASNQITGNATITTLNLAAGITLTGLTDTNPTVSYPNITVVTFNPTGSVGNLITIDYVNFVKSSGSVTADYLNLSNSSASGGATFLAGSHSNNITGNTGWYFIDPALVNVQNPTVAQLIIY